MLPNRLPRGLPLLAVLLLTGCATLSPAHVLFDTGRHPWHAWPGAVGFTVVGLGAMIGLLPLAFTESALTGSSSLYDDRRPTVTKTLALGTGLVAGYALAAPFFVVGLPLEFAIERAKTPAELTASRPSAPASRK